MIHTCNIDKPCILTEGMFIILCEGQSQGVVLTGSGTWGHRKVLKPNCVVLIHLCKYMKHIELYTLSDFVISYENSTHQILKQVLQTILIMMSIVNPRVGS